MEIYGFEDDPHRGHDCAFNKDITGVKGVKAPKKKDSLKCIFHPSAISGKCVQNQLAAK